MRIAVLSCALGALAAGCSNRPDRSQGNPAQTASVITAGSDTGAIMNARDQTHQAKSLEAPQRLRGLLPMLDRYSKMPLDQFNQNITAFKNEVANAVEAMSADLVRERTSEGKFREHAGTVMEPLGGGVGSTAKPLTEEERRKVIAGVRQLIHEYQVAMNTHRPPGDSS
ncbi:MAG TPA: hypothetical protein VFS33_09525 [Gemmatimonadales bacterium]|nr:hypothetical protein [Gemmatimonadales bacterium]